MKTLRATPGPEGWRLTLHYCSRPEGEVRDALAEALVVGRGLLLDWYCAERELPEVWRLEVAKSAIDSGEIAMGLAASLAKGCAEQPNSIHEISGPEQYLCTAAFARQFAANGLSVKQGDLARLVRVSDGLAVVASLIALVVMIILRGGHGRFPKSPDLLFAIHGESSTRSRHLLKTLADTKQPAAILLVGRSKMRTSALQAAWRKETVGVLPPMVRAWSRLSAVISIPAGLRILSSAPVAWRKAPWVPPWRERVAQAWRCLLGSASAQWWKMQREHCKAVVFGHTGTAETHLLERAMQASGARTLHAVHGLSGGINFVAYSDVSIWRCGADATWHRSLQTYGQCIHVPAVRPTPLTCGSGVLLMTNLAHPMNPLYRYAGLQAERDVVLAVARSADPSTIVRWRPHPVSGSLKKSERRELAAIASTAGVTQLVGHFDMSYEIRRANRVFCTPSTTVMDVVVGGRIPQLVGDCRWASHIVFRKRDNGAVGTLSPAGSFASDYVCANHFSQIWEALEPAAPLSLLQLIEMAE